MRGHLHEGTMVEGEKILAQDNSFWVPLAHTKDLPLRG